MSPGVWDVAHILTGAANELPLQARNTSIGSSHAAWIVHIFKGHFVDEVAHCCADAQQLFCS
jgi:hypothetical protein